MALKAEEVNELPTELLSNSMPGKRVVQVPKE
jgi:hypothetical protein